MIEKLSEIHPLLPPVTGALALLIAALVADLLVRNIVVKAVQTVAKRSRVTWDDTLIRHRVISRLVQIVPGLIVFSGVQLDDMQVGAIDEMITWLGRHLKV